MQKLYKIEYHQRERNALRAHIGMLHFFRENTRTLIRLHLNQFGAAFLGILLGLAVPMKRVVGEEIPRENMTLLLITSLFSICFFLYLNHTVLWEEGAKNRIRIDAGRAKYNPLGGLPFGLLAGVINLLLGILAAGGYFLGDPMGPVASELFAKVSDVSGAIALLWQGMYLGTIRYLVPDNMYIFLAVPIPAILGCVVSYWLGLKQFRLANLFKKKKN